MESESGGSERKKASENPPANDLCPICLEDFTFPCRTDCNHWFCANCILECWRYGVARKPCKCPLCSSSINRLTPRVSVHYSQEAKAAEAMKSIYQYNRRYVGGIQGLLVVICELPLLLRRLLLDMMDPDNFNLNNFNSYFPLVQSTIVMFSIILYSIGGITDPELLQCYAMRLVLSMCLVGFCRKYRLFQRVWQLAARRH